MRIPAEALQAFLGGELRAALKEGSLAALAAAAQRYGPYLGLTAAAQLAVGMQAAGQEEGRPQVGGWPCVVSADRVGLGCGGAGRSAGAAACL